MTPVDIDYFSAEYCLDRDFHLLIPNRELLDIYTDDSQLDNWVRSGI